MKYKVNIIKQKDFPEKIKNIKNSPKQLYAIGNIELLYEYCFGIVGTRRPTEYGILTCREFAKEFALRNIAIVSGMAEGIDEMAHKTSLEFESKTIAVLGCGFDYYLNTIDNAEIFHKIIEKSGLILSEYDVTVEKSKEKFPMRNRIIAAIAEGILVIEAAYRSGSSITAKYAKEYGKNVFAVPGRIGDKMSVGTNNLIKRGAILSTSFEELITNYPQFVNKKRKTISRFYEIKKKSRIKEEWKKIVNILKIRMLSIEEIQNQTGNDIRILMKILSEMELEGIIEQEIGIGYKLKKEIYEK